MASTGSGRGGGYDAYIDKQSETRKALSADTQQSLGAQAEARSPGANPQAPSSLGDLMTPSSMRMGQPSSPEEYDARVSENHAFLTNPETQDSMLQFATAMLGGGEHMRALGLGMRQNIQNETENSQRAQQLALTKRGQDIELLGQAIQAKGPPTELMKTIAAANEAKARGDMKTYNLSMSRAFNISNEFAAAQGMVASIDEKTGQQTFTIVPRSKQDLEAKQAEIALVNAKEEMLGRGARVTLAANQVITALDNAPIDPNLTVAGWGGLINFLPDTDTLVAGEALQTILSNLTVENLRAMRDSNPNHAAFGNVSDHEDDIMAHIQASLKQTLPVGVLKKNIKTAQFVFDPTTMDARHQIAQNLADNKIDNSTAIAQYNKLLTDYIDGGAAGADGFDPMKVPSYSQYASDPELQRLWPQMRPEEMRGYFNDQDKLKFDNWVRQRAQNQSAPALQ